MGEHDHLSNSQLRAKIQSRLAQGKPVGRLINSAQSRGQSTSGYQSQRTTTDVAAHVRWKSYQGQAALEESAELAGRAKGPGQTGADAGAGEHSHLTTEQVHALVRGRLAEGKRVGRLIKTLHKRGENTSQYQSKRTTPDIEAQIRWQRGQGTAEEERELARRSSRSVAQRFEPVRGAPLSSVPSLVRSKKTSSIQALEGQPYDVFISHASDDKDTIVHGLATALGAAGLRVWYDDFELRIGDSLRRKIDHGIANSRFGVVVLSHAFFSKGWTNYELDGIVTKAGTGEQVLLPIWHNVSRDEVIAYSPSLADKLARSTATHTVEEIALEIASAIKGTSPAVSADGDGWSGSNDLQEPETRTKKRPWWKVW